MTIYYQYCSIPKKQRNPSYSTFKSKHIPFPWDKVNIKEVEIDETETLQQLESAKLTPQDWMDKIKNLKPTGKKVDESQLKNI